ncbi:MAG: hypothetical protein ACI9Q3_000605 [Maribacter sp.]|jgi:hypothetical protein
MKKILEILKIVALLFKFSFDIPNGSKKDLSLNIRS